ncbi:MAG: helix-turn-helix transcriptional regulator [Cytophagales bacterium]|nr:helix-turn-helix transcriptional regulator [Cytophagales bacterium]
MHRRVIIIHGSDVIRLGLNTLIQSYFDIEPVLLGNINELKDYYSILNSRIIFLIDSQLDQIPLMSRIDTMDKSNSIKIVLIRERADESMCSDECKCCFSIMDPKSRIFDIIGSYLKLTSKNSGNKGSSWLTEREIEVVKLVAFGKTNKEIAKELCISIHTVISHRKNITEKLGIKSISGLTVYAILNNLIDASSIDLE